MKAVVCTKYGPPDILQLKEVETPTPKVDEVLVRILAASANPLDWHRMRGAPFLARLDGGLRKPKDPRLGADIAGQKDSRRERGKAGRRIRSPNRSRFRLLGARGERESVRVAL